MTPQNSAGDPLLTGPHDPEHEPSATYAFEPEYAAALTTRLVATSGESVVVSSPLTGQPLAHVPQSSDADVAEAFRRARRAQTAWARTPLDERAAVLLRLHDLILDRQDEIIDLIVLGVRQGPQARVRRADAHRADRPLLRPHRPPAPRHRAQARRRPAAHPRRRQPRAQGRGRHHLALELPASPWRCATASRPCSPATRSCAKPDAQTVLSALLGRRAAGRGRLPARPVAGRRRPRPRGRRRDHRPRRLHLLHRFDRHRSRGRQAAAPSG